MTTIDLLPSPLLEAPLVSRRSLREGTARAAADSAVAVTRRSLRRGATAPVAVPATVAGMAPTRRSLRHADPVTTPADADPRDAAPLTRRALRAAEAAKPAKTAKPISRASHRAATAERSSSLKQVLRALWNGLAGALFALALGLAALVVVIPIAVGGQAMTVLTNSMAPGLPPGTLVVVKPTPVEDIKVGDVLTYQIRPGEPDVVSHRVVSRTISTSGETTFITRGDNNDLDDQNPVQAVQIKGTVWYSLPLLGWVNSAVSGNSRTWLVPAVAIACFGYGAWAFTSSALNRRRKSRAKSATPVDEAKSTPSHGRRSRALAEGHVGAGN